MSLFWNEDESSEFWKAPDSYFWRPFTIPTIAYDDNGRLTQVIYDDGSSITYNYDNMGNRTSVVVTAS